MGRVKRKPLVIQGQHVRDNAGKVISFTRKQAELCMRQHIGGRFRGACELLESNSQFYLSLSLGNYMYG